MDSESGGWETASPLIRWHGWGWDMVALGNKAYVMGGFQDPVGDDWVLETMERYDEDTNQWSEVAWYPLYLFNHCMVADEETGRIWVVGGQHRAPQGSKPTDHDWSELRYYEVPLLLQVKFSCNFLGVFQHLARHLAHEVAPETPCLWNCQNGIKR